MKHRSRNVSIARPPFSTRLLDVLERAIGRRRLWRISRRVYMHVRRQGSLVLELNGEGRLQHELSCHSAKLAQPLVIVDIGANYGQWSRSMIACLKDAGAPRARMLLFEPVPVIRDALAAFAEEATEIADVEIFGVAVSDKAGTAMLHMGDAEAAHHHLATTRFPSGAGNIEVEVVTFDDFAAGRQLDRIDLVKIDAEGFDLQVVAGMAGLLSDGRINIVQIEYSALLVRARGSLYDLFELGRAVGYRVGQLTFEGMELFAEWHPEIERFFGSAMVLVHPRAFDIVPVREVTFGLDNTYS